MMSLVGKEYDNEDFNIKFLLTLPKQWDLKTTTIRDNNDLEKMSLDEVYGMLKSHELEMQQKKNRKRSKVKSVVLAIEQKPFKFKDANSSHYKGKGQYDAFESDLS